MSQPAFAPRPAMLAALALALLLAACGGAITEILPEGEIQLQTSEAEAETLSAEAAQEVAEPSVDNPPAEPSAEVALPQSAVLPPIVPGSPEFHVSRVEDFALASGRVQLVEFFAYWCPTCKSMAPTVHGLENLYADQIDFVYLDRDDPSTLIFQEQLGYIYQPHFFLLDPSGLVLDQWRGVVDGAELQRALVAALQ